MINTSEYELIDATPLIRLALNKEVAKAYKEESKGVNFIKYINQLAQQIDSLPLQHEPFFSYAQIFFTSLKFFAELNNR